jgi:hypothetical protein
MVSFLLRSGFLLAFFLFGAGVPPGHAEPVRIAGDVVLDGTVLAVEPPMAGMRFFVTWETPDRIRYQTLEITHGGDAPYDMRKYPVWKGKADAVYLEGLGKVPASVRKPGLAEEWGIFMAPEPWIMSTVNALHGHTLLSVPWEVILAVVFFLSAAVFFSFNRRLALSVTLGFLAAWSLLYVRTVADEAGFLRYAGNNQPLLVIGKTGEWFAGTVAERIRGGKWSAGELSDFRGNIARYELAEVPFSAGPEGKDRSWRIVIRQDRLFLEPPAERGERPAEGK